MVVFVGFFLVVVVSFFVVVFCFPKSFINSLHIQCRQGCCIGTLRKSLTEINAENIYEKVNEMSLF